MLKSITKSEIDRIADFLFSALENPDSASYPRYGTYAEAELELAARLNDTNSFALAHYAARDRVASVLVGFYGDDRYLQTTAFTAADSCGYAEFLEYLFENYPDFDMHIGVNAENILACSALESAGFDVLEASYDMRLLMSDFRPCPADMDVFRINMGNFSEYAPFHDAHFQGVYWDSEKIKDRLDDWYVFAAYESGRIRAGLFMTANGDTAEIYGLSADAGHRELLLPLMSRGISALHNIQNVIFMVEESTDDTDALVTAAQSVGFMQCGRYRLYHKRT